MVKTVLVASAVLSCIAAATLQAQTPGSSGAEVVRASGEARGQLGFEFMGVPEMRPGAAPRWADYPVVKAVIDGSPAQAAGLQVGDAIIAVNERDGREVGLFRKREPGTKYVLRVRRGDEEREVEFVLVDPAQGSKPAGTP